MRCRCCVRSSQQAVAPRAHTRFVGLPILPARGRHDLDFLPLDSPHTIGYDCKLTRGRRLWPAAKVVAPCRCQPQFNSGRSNKT
jgi:hypothetical protein